MRALLIALLLTSCATAPPVAKRAPWRQTPLQRANVPAVYAQQWEKAENRATCALVAPMAVGEAGAGATPRAANFSGGWAVAYDLPNVRSAFGIAGAGVKADDPSYDKWPYVQQWDDGSRAEYGPEGGEGPNQLAYVKIQGQQCLYNVWSRLGREHLEFLLQQIRLVE
jgi:hypothetical protein